MNKETTGEMRAKKTRGGQYVHDIWVEMEEWDSGAYERENRKCACVYPDNAEMIKTDTNQEEKEGRT